MIAKIFFTNQFTNNGCTIFSGGKTWITSAIDSMTFCFSLGWKENEMKIMNYITKNDEVYKKHTWMFGPTTIYIFTRSSIPLTNESRQISQTSLNAVAAAKANSISLSAGIR